MDKRDPVDKLDILKLKPFMFLNGNEKYTEGKNVIIRHNHVKSWTGLNWSFLRNHIVFSALSFSVFVSKLSKYQKSSPHKTPDSYHMED